MAKIIGLAPRLLIAIGIFTAAGSLHGAFSTRTIEYPRGISALIPLDFLLTPIAMVLLVTLFLAALTSWTMGIREEPSGWTVVVLLALGLHLSLGHHPIDEVSNRAVNLPGAGLAAYLIWRKIARMQGDHSRQNRIGFDAFCGIAAICYALAGANKIWAPGVAWATGVNLANHITTHALLGSPIMLDLRLWVASQEVVCMLLGVGTLVIECGFVLFILRKYRPILSILAVVFHLSIGLIVGLHHPDWMFTVAGLGLHEWLNRPTTKHT